ncbi:MAG: hypothetical protein ACE5EN_05405 [Nitrospinota bacterium]
MREVDWIAFYNGFDFDDLWAAIESGSWKWILSDHVVWGIGVILLCMIAYRNTRSIGTFAIGWGMIGLFYGIGLIVLKNSSIRQAGPFALLGIMFFGVVGYLAWTKLLNPK